MFPESSGSSLVIVGRSRTANLVVADPSVSRQHLHVRAVAEGVLVELAPGASPFLHRAQPVSSATLAAGDHVIVGSTVLSVVDELPDDAVHTFAETAAQGIDADIRGLSVVGSLLDKYGARPVFMGAAAVQLVFFALMAGSRELWALVIALGFMLGAFGQIPINDFMIGKMASGAARARVYGIRYVVSFTALACALPLISFVYERWGFDTLFYVLSGSAMAIFVLVTCLPRKMPVAQTAAA